MGWSGVALGTLLCEACCVLRAVSRTGTLPCSPCCGAVAAGDGAEALLPMKWQVRTWCLT